MVGATPKDGSSLNPSCLGAITRFQPSSFITFCFAADSWRKIPITLIDPSVSPLALYSLLNGPGLASTGIPANNSGELKKGFSCAFPNRVLLLRLEDRRAWIFTCVYAR